MPTVDRDNKAFFPTANGRSAQALALTDRTQHAFARRVRYKMRGTDANLDGVTDTWIVYDNDDPTGAQYAGALATPLRDIVIAAVLRH
jgi:hypothetical protein